MQQIVDEAGGSWLEPLPGTMQEEVEDQKDIVEAYEMMNGMCERRKQLKCTRCKCQDTRDFPLEEERNEICYAITKLLYG